MTNRISDSAADFLYFYLLGVTIEDITNMDEKDLIVKCAERAYLDLNRTLKFKKIPKEEKEHYQELQEQKKEFRTKISNEIADSIMELLKTKQNYDNWHQDTCEKKIIIKAKEYEQKGCLQKNGKESFYYGQAQKWLNMTIKYMWITGKWECIFENLIDYLHVPVDSYIIKAVLECEDFSEVKKVIPKQDIEKDKVENNILPWSKWIYTDYISFQEAIRTALKDNKKMTPFEWEGNAWIEIAKRSK